MISSFADLLSAVKGRPKKTIAAAMAEEDDVLKALFFAQQQNIADAVLVGNKNKILEIAREHSIPIGGFDIVHAESEQQAVSFAIQLIREHLADTLMKGMCSTATLLKGVLDREQGLRSGNILSHFAAFEVPAYAKLLFMSDAAMNIAPDFTTKAAIIENAVQILQHFGISAPKVAVIAAVEKVNAEAMPCTRDAALLAQMGARTQIKHAIIDGPLAVDNAVSGKSCEVKGIKSQVGGDADFLLMPDIEAANVFYKTMTYLGNSKTAGIITGATVPIILTSRADSSETKFLSIALAVNSSVREI
jgi:phosphate butyryltransferase